MTRKTSCISQGQSHRFCLHHSNISCAMKCLTIPKITCMQNSLQQFIWKFLSVIFPMMDLAFYGSSLVIIGLPV